MGVVSLLEVPALLLLPLALLMLLLESVESVASHSSLDRLRKRRSLADLDSTEIKNICM